VKTQFFHLDVPSTDDIPAAAHRRFALHRVVIAAGLLNRDLHVRLNVDTSTSGVGTFTMPNAVIVCGRLAA
jgi:hypothetical protein